MVLLLSRFYVEGVLDGLSYSNYIGVMYGYTGFREFRVYRYYPEWSQTGKKIESATGTGPAYCLF